MRLRSLLLLAAWAAAAAAGRAADWPQWRGPDRNDVSKETGLLQAWPEGGPKLLWTFRDAGGGYSGPALVGAVLYIMGAEHKTDDSSAFDTKTCKKAWRVDIGPG